MTIDRYPSDIGDQFVDTDLAAVQSQQVLRSKPDMRISEKPNFKPDYEIDFIEPLTKEPSQEARVTGDIEDDLIPCTLTSGEKIFAKFDAIPDQQYELGDKVHVVQTTINDVWSIVTPAKKAPTTFLSLQITTIESDDKMRFLINSTQQPKAGDIVETPNGFIIKTGGVYRVTFQLYVTGTGSNKKLADTAEIFVGVGTGVTPRYVENLVLDGNIFSAVPLQTDKDGVITLSGVGGGVLYSEPSALLPNYGYSVFTRFPIVDTVSCRVLHFTPFGGQGNGSLQCESHNTISVFYEGTVLADGNGRIYSGPKGLSGVFGPNTTFTFQNGILVAIGEAEPIAGAGNSLTRTASIPANRASTSGLNKAIRARRFNIELRVESDKIFKTTGVIGATQGDSTYTRLVYGEEDTEFKIYGKLTSGVDEMKHRIGGYVNVEKVSTY